jgi:hypothetical protein
VAVSVDDGRIDDSDIGGSGYSLDELSAYLDRGRSPAIAAIDTNAECRALLDGMQRLGSLSRSLVEHDSAIAPQPAPGWLETVMSSVTLEVRAGRDIPYPAATASVELSISEGAVRELVRRAGDGVPGVLVGRVRVADERVELSVSAVADRPLRLIADEVRAAVQAELQRHTPVNPAAVDVTIADVRETDS